jgi:four helix bundle protein
MGKKVERFEDLLAWQKAIKVAQHIYMISRRQPFSRDFALCDQIRRAANSIASNIAEGFERGSRAEFHRFLSIAKGSCAEVRTQIYLARRIGYIDEMMEAELLREAESTAQVIGKLRISVARQRATPRMPHAALRMPPV